MYTVYLIKSTKYKWYYVGMTSSLYRRLKRHNKGRVKSTKFYRPFKLIYTKQFDKRQEARQYEEFVKISSNKEKLIRQAEVAELADA